MLIAASPRPRRQPQPMIFADDADAPVRKRGDDRPGTARDDAAALTLRMTAQRAPFLECENGVIVLDKPLAKLPLVGAGVLKPLLALLLGFGLLDGGTLRTAPARHFGFTEGHGLDPNDGNRPGKAGPLHH
jgi:hypothetical protein